MLDWLCALGTVLKPIIYSAGIWLTWQLGIGVMAWSTARFYGINCAPPGLSGFISSLFAMGNPICVSTWLSHAAFVVTYVASFIAAVMITIIWVWRRAAAYPVIHQLRQEIADLKIKQHKN